MTANNGVGEMTFGAALGKIKALLDRLEKSNLVGGGTGPARSPFDDPYALHFTLIYSLIHALLEEEHANWSNNDRVRGMNVIADFMKTLASSEDEGYHMEYRFDDLRALYNQLSRFPD